MDTRSQLVGGYLFNDPFRLLLDSSFWKNIEKEIKAIN